MDREGWHYFSNHSQLEQVFWATFESKIATGNLTEEQREAIKVGRRVGIALRHEFQWERVVDWEKGEGRYLEALVDVGKDEWNNSLA